jgi:hypothetical protein
VVANIVQEVADLLQKLALLGHVERADLLEFDAEGSAEDLLCILTSYQGSRFAIASRGLVGGLFELVDAVGKEQPLVSCCVRKFRGSTAQLTAS